MNFTKYFSTIDTQVGGETFRIVTNSSIRIANLNLVEAQQILDEQYTVEKNLLLNEPRGHRGINGCLVVPSVNADVGLLFFQHAGGEKFKTEALVAVVTALVEMGTLEAKEVVQVETSNGVETVTIKEEQNEVMSVKVSVQAAKVIEKVQENVKVQVADDRQYIICPLPSSVPTLTVEHLGVIQRWGNTEAQKWLENEEGVGVILFEQNDEQVRTVTFDRDGYILRSPGIDTSLVLAAINEQSSVRNVSIFDEVFEIVKEPNKDVFSIELQAFITAVSDFTLDEEDPLPQGFIII